MQTGRKGKKSLEPLDFNPRRYRSKGAAFAAFSKRYITTPKGRGADTPFKVREWQRDIIETALDPEVSSLLVSIPRGNGKSTLIAALAIFHILCEGVSGARAVIVAQDERSAQRLLSTARRMVETSEELDKRLVIYKDRIWCPASDSVIVALPAEPMRIEGEDASLAILDEVGYCTRESYEALLHSTGKRDNTTMIMIGTPSVPSWREKSPMLDLVLEGRLNADPHFKLIEYGGDIAHPVNCQHCRQVANPGYGDLVSERALADALPPKSRESEYRRARLGEWVEQDDKALFPPGVWEGLSNGQTLTDNTEVVLAFDGSFSQDSTALLAMTTIEPFHIDVVNLWERPSDAPDTWQVPVLEVEQAIRDAVERFNVVELTADPFRWKRTLEILRAEGVPISEFNQSSTRMTPATTDFYQAARAGEITHSGDPRLARHIANAVIDEDKNGVRLAKERRNSRRKIDLAVCAVMAHSRAAWYAHNRPKRRRTVSFAT